MGNIIGLNSKTPIENCLSMSNGLTSVFIDVLSLSGSKLAVTDDEKKLIIYISEKDQSKVGLGTVGFDICEMPWNVQNFEKNKVFLLKVISDSKKKSMWEFLDYAPNEEMLLPMLDKFYKLVSNISLNDIDEVECAKSSEEYESEKVYNHDGVLDFPVCPKHHILLSVFGCHICNN